MDDAKAHFLFRLYFTTFATFTPLDYPNVEFPSFPTPGFRFPLNPTLHSSLVLLLLSLLVDHQELSISSKVPTPVLLPRQLVVAIIKNFWNDGVMVHRGNTIPKILLIASVQHLEVGERGGKYFRDCIFGSLTT